MNHLSRRAFLAGSVCLAAVGAVGPALALQRRSGLMAVKGDVITCPNGHEIATFLEDAYLGQMPWPKMQWHVAERHVGQINWPHCDHCGESFVKGNWNTAQVHLRTGWRGSV